MQDNQTKKIGNLGEERASQYLINKGYEIIARNWRTRFGEVDIICVDGDSLVFVEVKNLPHSADGFVPIVLSKRKQQKIIDTSKHFLNSYRIYNSKYIRYDVVVLSQGASVEEDIEHITAAFSESV